jgi:hypothetical protein
MRTRFAGPLLAGLAALAACSAPRPKATGSASDEVFAVTGKVAGGAARFAPGDLGALPRREFRASDPRQGEERRFSGVAVAKLLDEGFEVERGADVAVFHARDGYQIAIPIAVLRQHRPVLADRIDGVPVAEARPGAGPLVLAWPNVEQPGLTHDPRARWWWVDGVTSLEVSSWMGAYGRALRVPSGASDEARSGSGEFANSCMPCHQIRGVGGSRGPDLSEKLSEPGSTERLEARVREHEKRAFGKGVAELSPQTIRHIGSFLRVVALAGPIRPQDEPIEPPPEPRDRSGAVGPY